MSKWKQVERCDCLSYGRYIVPNFASNTVAINDVVISPGASLLDSYLSEHDDVAKSRGLGLNIVMPNSYHYMGVEAWFAALPEARLLASHQARSRLEAKGLSNIHVISEGDPGPIEGSFWAVPPGHRGGDVWLVIPLQGDFQGKWAWVTCDSFLHYPRMSNQPIARLTQRIMGAAPGLKLSRVIKYLLLTDRAKFKHWALDFLEHYPPALLMPSHGDPRVGIELTGEIRSLLRARL